MRVAKFQIKYDYQLVFDCEIYKSDLYYSISLSLVLVLTSASCNSITYLYEPIVINIYIMAMLINYNKKRCWNVVYRHLHLKYIPMVKNINKFQFHYRSHAAVWILQTSLRVSKTCVIWSKMKFLLSLSEKMYAKKRIEGHWKSETVRRLTGSFLPALKTAP